MRVLCKQGFSRDMADQLIGDIRFALKELNALEYPTPTHSHREKHSSYGQVVPTTPQIKHTGKTDRYIGRLPNSRRIDSINHLF